jgi:hypothetical protein
MASNVARAVHAAIMAQTNALRAIAVAEALAWYIGHLVVAFAMKDFGKLTQTNFGLAMTSMMATWLKMYLHLAINEVAGCMQGWRMRKETRLQ